MEAATRFNEGETLGEQIELLRGVDFNATYAIESIVEDEQAHHDKAALEPRQGIFWPSLLRPMVGAATELVIWMGMKL
jgi:3-demethoxyubiquinol 3-hydroxylase